MTGVVAGLLVLIALLLVASLGLGDLALSWNNVASALMRSGVSSPIETIVLDVRLPRALLALLVGMALAAAGALAQTVTRNPLAEPGILGINAGAALAATVLIVALPGVSTTLLPWAGFAGAVVAAAAVYALAWRAGTSSLRIVLIGIGLGSLAGAATAFLTAFGDVRAVQRALVWLAGSIYDADWLRVRVLALWLVGPLALTCLSWRELDLARFGDPVARGLGQRGDRVRGLMILLCALMSGSAVAAAGLIGFVGLIAPHIARRIAGPRHARQVPVAILTGGALMMAADLLGRTIIAPAQLPAGLVTALIGAPFFAWLLWRRRHVPA